MESDELLKKAEKVASYLSLKKIHLWKANCERNISFRPKRAKVDITVDAKILDLKNTDIIPISCDCKIVGVDIEKNEKAVELNFTFCAVYFIQKDLKPKKKLNKAELNAFAATNAVFDVWPYFREHTQDFVVKMDLPALVLPPVTINQLAKKAKEKKLQE